MLFYISIPVLLSARRKLLYEKTTAIILSLTIVLGSVIPSLAALRDEDFTVGRYFDWSPYCSTTTYSGRTTSGGEVLREYITAYSEFYWDEDGVEAMGVFYPTLEQNAIDGSGLSAEDGDQYCNIANIHFDYDDDTNDGDNEESLHFCCNFNGLIS